MIHENHQKRIVTNEDLMDSILGLKESLTDLRASTLDGFDRVFQTIDDAKAELRSEFKNDINELRTELKNDTAVLRKEMNQRFSVVDKKFIIIDERLTAVDGRLSNIEDNTAHKHQLLPKFA